MIKRYEANSLEEACSLAVNELNIPIEKLEYEIVQYPSKGILGLFAKKAIIVVVADDKKEQKEVDGSINNKEQEPIKTEVKKEDTKKETAISEIESKSKNDNIAKKSTLVNNSDEAEIFDSFYGKKSAKNSITKEYESVDAQYLESEIKRLLKSSCFNLDTIEVDIEDNTAYVFIDGDDAALLIGKEGYRYNALSYLLFNWINSKYGLYLKLEIAQFLASQQDMIKHQLQSVIEHVQKEGWGRTKELDGILVQIALEYLRDTFPNKYVAIKKTKDGNRYILINEFNKR
jgi:spoIIIJ-associated protein